MNDKVEHFLELTLEIDEISVSIKCSANICTDCEDATEALGEIGVGCVRPGNRLLKIARIPVHINRESQDDSEPLVWVDIKDPEKFSDFS